MGSQDPCTSSSSTMELPTQEIGDGEFLSEEEDEETPSNVWGRLFPIGESFTAMDLIKEEYTFGRAETCDYVFNSPLMKKHKCFQAYSKVHFIIRRVHSSTGTHVFLEDKSSNGAFVNGEKVGKDAKQVLNNNDEIGLSLIKNKAFVFLDLLASDNNRFPKEISKKYTVTKVLGRGACGEVRLAFQKGTCSKYAVKIISKKAFSLGGQNHQNISPQIQSEIAIMKSLKHHAIIKIEDVIDTPDTVYIVLELLEGGELFDRLANKGSFSEDRAKLYIYQILLAIDYLHRNGITHRDLKPENILMVNDDDDTLIKVTDFGLSKFVDAVSMMKTFCGTPNYLAPEILLTAGSGSYTKAVDCWSVGVIAFICLVAYPPFSDEITEMDLQTQITGGHYSFPDQYWHGISDTDLIKKLLTVDPKKRIAVDAALKHPWFKDESMKKKVQKLIEAHSDSDVKQMSPPKNPPSLKRVGQSKNERPAKKFNLKQ
ncbi:serine/threonine-protein kinase Chk2-like isoform X2 [Tubulanus polymorphus]|uniref:serine/threonine-protein kinase Chk2-like isoform X2 n=1 Tax=Tubulanus polymorphus TaxID=672921 RepID=UPI003DA552E6